MVAVLTGAGAARRRAWPVLALACAFALGLALELGLIAPAQAERIRDLASVQGVRGNQLIGYGLVVGLDGSGDQTTQTPFTMPGPQIAFRPEKCACAGPPTASVRAAAARRNSSRGRTIATA